LESPLLENARIPVEEKYEALWIPDDRATHCLMEGCSSQFSTLRRRHHCRVCGWLICNRCTAKAPVKKHNFDVEKVCPQCYDDIMQQHARGQLFPEEHAAYGKFRSMDGKTIEISSMFTPPAGGFRKKMAIQTRKSPEIGGQVYFRTAKANTEQLKWAVLDGLMLQFYDAEYDEIPCLKVLIFGYSLHTEDLDDGSRLFQLRHANQFKTDKKETVIAFRVVHNGSSEKWLQALGSALK